MIVIVFGLPGSGKSYFASRLARMINADYINSDKVRLEVVDKKTYSEKEKLAVYNEMLVQMKKVLQQNRNVVLDATFYKNEIRKQFMEEAERKCSTYFIEVTADESAIKERLQRKRMDSDADFEVYKKINTQWEPLKRPHLELHATDQNIEEMLSTAADYLNLKDDKRTDQ
jgi:predicted kinase